MKLFCLFPCLSSSHEILPIYRNSFTPFAYFIVKYQSMSVIWIGLTPALLSVGGAVILTPLPLGPSSWTLSVPDPSGPFAPPVLFGSALDDPGWPLFLCPPGLSVLWCWWVCLGLAVMCSRDHHFLILYNTV